MNGYTNGYTNGHTNGHTRECNFYEKNDVKEFLDSIHQLILDKALNDGTKNDHKVVEFLHPKEMLNKLQLDIGEKGTNNEVLLKFCEKLINMSVKTGKPGFYNQLYGFVDPYGLAGSWITDSLNTALHTYEVSPAFTMIEHYLIQKVCKMIGFQNGDGMFCPGGAFMNIMSIHLARFRNDNNIKKQGMYNQERMVVFASEGCHYSSVLAVGFLGIGQENLIKVKTDSKGKMSVKHLQNAVELSLKQGLNPIAVVATAGTTVLGAFDPLNEIADVCAQHNMWLHVDAAWGGFVLMSKKHRYRMAGVERVDSLAWNFHKMGNAPMQCSLLVVKEKGILEKCNSTNVEYLFQSDKYYDKTFDQGNKTIQCGKKVDNFKLWLMWKARGDAGMAAKMDRVMELSQYLVDQLRAQDDFRLVLPEFEYSNICFWYIPPSLENQEETEEWWQKLSKVGPKIKERMVSEGTLMVGYQPLPSMNKVNFFRFVLCQENCEESDLDFIIEEIRRFGKDLQF
ncbi:cysteine sulfinic acid decarboxylase-like [Octopus vulgaris]|nr:cysteine sulfinic acid decarboxylase-like [Octopus vulgaris]